MPALRERLLFLCAGSRGACTPRAAPRLASPEFADVERNRSVSGSTDRWLFPFQFAPRRPFASESHLRSARPPFFFSSPSILLPIVLCCRFFFRVALALQRASISDTYCLPVVMSRARRRHCFFPLPFPCALAPFALERSLNFFPAQPRKVISCHSPPGAVYCTAASPSRGPSSTPLSLFEPSTRNYCFPKQVVGLAS